MNYLISLIVETTAFVFSTKLFLRKSGGQISKLNTRQDTRLRDLADVLSY